jgi:hypothetical protein
MHSLRHYSATELIAAGVDVRTVAGRLGHGSGGATTLARRPSPATRVRDRLRAARQLVIRRGWHRAPVIGRPLRWLGRRLPRTLSRMCAPPPITHGLRSSPSSPDTNPAASTADPAQPVTRRRRS